MDDGSPIADDKGKPHAPTAATRRKVLSACVARMKADGLSGKGRDDAAGHFMAGVNATLEASGLAALDVPGSGKYLDVLEAMAD